MKRLVLAAVGAVVVLGAGAAALVGWFARVAPVAPGRASAEAAPPPVPPAALLELPAGAAARDRALSTNEERRDFAAFARGFGAAERSPTSEGRLLPALDALFAGGGPRWRLECRRLLCRLDVDAPASEWRAAFAENAGVRQQVDRSAFDPEGAGLAFVELVEARAAAGPARPDGEKVLDELERALLDSEAARGCLAEGPAPGAEVRLRIDRSGITYRFGSGVDSRIATCLMMQAMPDVVGGASAPPGVRRAERVVLVRAAP